MTEEQQSEIERRSALIKEGKLKTSSWEDVKKRTKASNIKVEFDLLLFLKKY